MPEQILRIEPDHELKFKGPFNVPSTTLLKIINPSEKRVCFKIKTTAPKRYCVRPNAGLLQPGTSANIAVVFQPCDLEPTANKHKFMVQALYAPDGDATVDMDALWKDVDNTKLMDTKLRCTFEMPADSGNQNELNASDEGKVTRAKHEDSYAAKKDQVAVADEPSITFELADDTTAYRSDMASEESHGHSGDTSATRLSVQQETIQLRQENGQLKDEIDRLKRQLKSREASGYSGMAMQNANPPATPMLQIIIALVVLLVGLVMGKFIV